MRRGLVPPPPTNVNLFTADASVTKGLKTLPKTREEAFALASKSAFVRSVLPEGLLSAYESYNG